MGIKPTIMHLLQNAVHTNRSQDSFLKKTGCDQIQTRIRMGQLGLMKINTHV